MRRTRPNPRDKSARGSSGKVFHHPAGDAKSQIVGNTAIDEVYEPGPSGIEIAFDQARLNAQTRQRVPAFGGSHAL